MVIWVVMPLNLADNDDLKFSKIDASHISFNTGLGSNTSNSSTMFVS